MDEIKRKALELLAAEYERHGVYGGVNTRYSEIDCAAIAAIEAALAQAPAENAAAKHWHDLYRKECQLRQDDAARYGQQIVDLEAQAPAVRVTGTHRYEESGRGWCKHCGYAAHVAEQHGAALGQGKGS